LKNIFPFRTKVSRLDRENLLRQNALVIWFTGLSGSGKSTLAVQLEARLHQRGFITYLLDGDIVRSGLCSDLGFDDKSREENIRRIGEIARLFLDTGVITLVSFISPFKKERELARRLAGADSFVEIFVDCPIEVCEQRDVKGLYKRARAGEIANFTGINSPYEIPENPDLSLRSDQLSIQDCLDALLDLLLQRIERKPVEN